MHVNLKIKMNWINLLDGDLFGVIEEVKYFDSYKLQMGDITNCVAMR